MKVPWWAHLLHFGVAASGVLTVVGGLAQVVPGPIAIAGALVAASAGTVKNYLTQIATKTGE